VTSATPTYCRSARLAACALATFALLALPAQAGTLQDPEVTGDAGDAYHPLLDIQQVWFQPSGDGLGIFVHLGITASGTAGDPPRNEAYALALATSPQWSVLFRGNGSAWRLDLDGGAVSSVQLSRDGHPMFPVPPDSTGATVNGQTVGHTNDAYYQRYSHKDPDVVGVVLLNYTRYLPNGSLLTGLYALSTSQALAADTHAVACNGFQAHDCAPDTGTGRSYVVGSGPTATVPDLTVTADQAERQARPGAQVAFRLTVANTGSGHLFLQMKATLPPPWQAAFEPEQIHLAPGQSNATRLLVTVPAGAAAGPQAFQALASTGPAASAANLTVQVVQGQGALYALGWGPAPAPLVLAAGRSGTALATLRNTGPSSDTYSFAATGAVAAWLHALPPRAVPVGGQAAVAVNVTVPAGTPAGTYALNLIATSGAQPALSASQPVTVTVPAAGKASPGPALPLLLAAVAVAAVAGRRRAW
jgi:hypothetical protein